MQLQLLFFLLSIIFQYARLPTGTFPMTSYHSVSTTEDQLKNTYFICSQDELCRQNKLINATLNFCTSNNVEVVL